MPRSGLCTVTHASKRSHNAVCVSLTLGGAVVVLSGHARLVIMPVALDDLAAPEAPVPLHPAVLAPQSEGDVWFAALGIS